VVMAIIAGGSKALVSSVESVEDDTENAEMEVRNLKLTEKDVVCGIAASGSTPFVIAALREAVKGGAYAVLVRNTKPETSEDRVAHHTIVLNTRAEIISGSTRLKAGTAQTIFLKTLTSTVFVMLGHTYGGLMVDVKVTNKKLRKRAIRLVRQLTGLSEASAGKFFDLTGNSDFERNAKRAVVMYCKSVSNEVAERMLAEHGGNLRAIIGDVDYTKTEVGE